MSLSSLLDLLNYQDQRYHQRHHHQLRLQRWILVTIFMMMISSIVIFDSNNVGDTNDMHHFYVNSFMLLSPPRHQSRPSLPSPSPSSCSHSASTLTGGRTFFKVLPTTVGTGTTSGNPTTTKSTLLFSSSFALKYKNDDKIDPSLGTKPTLVENNAHRSNSGSSSTGISISNSDKVIQDDTTTVSATAEAEAETALSSMPWTTSISPSYTNHNQTLPFMPYYTYSKSLLFSKLSNVRPYYDGNNENNNNNNDNQQHGQGHGHVQQQSKYLYQQINNDTRIINECYSSDEYRKIRMTYYDGGNKIQVYNTLWYPNYDLGNVPLLGIDLICFNGRKCLCVVDFQPLTYLDGMTTSTDTHTNVAGSTTSSTNDDVDNDNDRNNVDSNNNNNSRIDLE